MLVCFQGGIDFACLYSGGLKKCCKKIRGALFRSPENSDPHANLPPLTKNVTWDTGCCTYPCVRRVLYVEGPVCEASSGEAPDPESSPYKTLHGAGGQQRRTRAPKGPQLKVKVRTQKKENSSGNGRKRRKEWQRPQRQKGGELNGRPGRTSPNKEG